MSASLSKMPWKLNLESNYTYTSTTCIRNLEPKWQNRTLHRNLITLFSHCFPMCSHCVRIVITLCSHCFTLFSRCSRSAFHLKAQSADRHRALPQRPVRHKSKQTFPKIHQTNGPMIKNIQNRSKLMPWGTWAVPWPPLGGAWGHYM